MTHTYYYNSTNTSILFSVSYQYLCQPIYILCSTNSFIILTVFERGLTRCNLDLLENIYLYHSCYKIQFQPCLQGEPQVIVYHTFCRKPYTQKQNKMRRQDEELLSVQPEQTPSPSIFHFKTCINGKCKNRKQQNNIICLSFHQFHNH